LELGDTWQTEAADEVVDTRPSVSDLRWASGRFKQFRQFGRIAWFARQKLSPKSHNCLPKFEGKFESETESCDGDL